MTYPFTLLVWHEYHTVDKAARPGVLSTETDLATLSNTRTDSRSCIPNESEGIRQMADSAREKLLQEGLEDLERVLRYTAATGNYGPVCRLIALLNEAQLSRGLPPCAPSLMDLYRTHTTAGAPTVH